MEARQADAAGYFSLPWTGTFIEAGIGARRLVPRR